MTAAFGGDQPAPDADSLLGLLGLGQDELSAARKILDDDATVRGLIVLQPADEGQTSRSSCWWVASPDGRIHELVRFDDELALSPISAEAMGARVRSAMLADPAGRAEPELGAIHG